MLDFLSSISIKCVNASSLVNSATVCGTTAIISPNITGSTKITSPIVCATSCVQGTKIFEGSSCLGNIYLATGATATNSKALCGCTPACFLGNTATATCASTAGNSLALCGCVPSCFLGATATASNSLALCGCTPACFLGATATATCASTAGNALALCGCIPSCFLGATATASNSSALCGCTPACFLGAGATATCASTAGNSLALCGCTPACFLGAGATANCATVSQIIQGNYTGGGGAQPACYIPSGCVRFNMMNCPGNGGYYDFLMMDTYAGGDVPYVTMLGIAKQSGSAQGILAVAGKGCTSATNWSYVNIITSANIGSQSVNYASTAGSAPANGGTATLSNAVCINYNNSSNSTYQLLWGSACGVYGTSCVCIQAATGVVYAQDFIAASDCRIKTCIKPICNALPTVLRLQGVCYHNCNDKNCETQLGFVAQDVQKIIPELVSHSKPSSTDEEDYGITDDKLGLKYEKFGAILVEAIKELDKKVNCLCKELNYYRNFNKD